MPMILLHKNKNSRKRKRKERWWERLEWCRSEVMSPVSKEYGAERQCFSLDVVLNKSHRAPQAYSPFSLPAACPCRPPRGWTVGIPLGCIELFCSPSYTLHLFKNKKVYKVLHRSICAQWKFQQVMMAILCTRHQLKPCLVLFMISTTPSWQTTACMHTYKDC